MKRVMPVVTGQRVRLRLLTEADLPMTLAWRNQDHIRKWFLNPNTITSEQHRAWFSNYIGRDDDFVFVIEEQQVLRKPAGPVSLYRIEWQRRCAEYGRLLIGEPDAVGLGLAREATAVLLDHASTQLGLREIELEVLRENQRALAIYCACGFETVDERDGVLKMVWRV
jgi:diamine N-acetyltransferase